MTYSLSSNDSTRKKSLLTPTPKLSYSKAVVVCPCYVTELGLAVNPLSKVMPTQTKLDFSCDLVCVNIFTKIEAGVQILSLASVFHNSFRVKL